MGCPCRDKNKKRESYRVILAGGTPIPKNSEAEAKAFAAKHPGSKVVKVAKGA